MDTGKDEAMTLKWMGAIIVLLSCGGFGFHLAAMHRQEEKNLRQLIGVLDYMECELEYRLTPLPELCRNAAEASAGIIQTLFLSLARELERQISPDAGCCINAALAALPNLSPDIRNLVKKLGKTLGRFDLPGQLRGLQAVRRETMQVLDKLTANQDTRLRSYQTLGLCAGAALAILFL